MKQFLPFLRKEFYHILRDPRTMLILLFMPVILIILFGYAISTEIKQSPFAVLDLRRDEVSARSIDRLRASEYFTLYKTVGSKGEIDRLFLSGKIKLAVIIAADNETGIHILSDATDPNEATALTQYASAILLSSAIMPATVGTVMPETLLLYNPQMKGAYNFVPGVMGLILILICALMTSVGIVKEKESGTMEVLLVSPLKPLSIILAKAMPYLLISIVNIATILLLSRFLLDVPVRGSITLVVALSVLYALVSLCLGLLISTLVDSQQAAMLVSGVALMLPVVLLSGMIFPVENMPRILRYLSDIVPAKWYISAVKDVMIKGLAAKDIIKEASILIIMAVTLTAISVKRFKIRL
jgi:ABC-2 type transport system permease protein